MTAEILVDISHPSDAFEVRRQAEELAQDNGFDARERAEIAIIASEAAGNVAKHARSGMVTTSLVRSGRYTAIQILCMDRGPGMTSVSRMLRDGVSTKGTAGTGLGAIKRLSTVFDAYSVP